MNAALAIDCEKALGEGGRLTRAIPGFTPREQQLELSTAIALAIENQSHLIAEAGTGTGKTFAYLIPCLLSGKKALISTATKTLQDQLFNKDIPLLLHALGIAARVQNLKGRANYICRYRTVLHTEEGRFATPQCAHEIQYVNEKLPELTFGERSELPEINEDSAVWPYVTSTSDNCLGNECAYFQECFLVKARKRALEANIVVINHHLFFADSRLKSEGFGDLLPGTDIVVFDEAHQLGEIAAHFYGQRLSSRQLQDLMADIIREWPILDLANQPLKQLSIQLDQTIDQLLLAIEHLEERVSWQKVKQNQGFMLALNKVLIWGQELTVCMSGDFPEQSGLVRCKTRLDQLMRRLQSFLSENTTDIRWLECFKQSLALNATPVEISESFQKILDTKRGAYIFTSATLTMAGSFQYFSKPLGLTYAQTLLLKSPFDFKEQALLYLPRGLPDPKEPSYHPQLVEKVVPIIEANRGRCFFLFTSHRALKQVAELLRNRLKFPLLVQGDEAKSILLMRFREIGNAVLLGTSTFWEGVDVKGDLLSCVIIDKLPFASPTDPVLQGRMAYLHEKGISSFDELTLPQAVLALKQGVGRLIRDHTDKGVLMIADPRLTGRDYGQHIFLSLPPLKKTRDEQTVLTFIHNLAMHETTSN